MLSRQQMWVVFVLAMLSMSSAAVRSTKPEEIFQASAALELGGTGAWPQGADELSNVKSDELSSSERPHSRKLLQSATQREYLFSFKRGVLDFDGLLDSWVGADYCNAWDHVDCSGTDVTAFDIDNTVYHFLSGTISPGLASLSSLQRLDLNEKDYLSGFIPLSFGGLSELVVLDLGKNRLSGTVGHILGGSLDTLSYLDLSENRLSGTIPLEVNSLYSIVTLNLGSNRISGTIPTELSELHGVPVTINLSNNLLSGTLPGVLASLESLETLDVSGNWHLCGSIPPALYSLGLVYSGTNLGNGCDVPRISCSTIIEYVETEDEYLNGRLVEFAPTVSNLPPGAYAACDLVSGSHRFEKNTETYFSCGFMNMTGEGPSCQMNVIVDVRNPTCGLWVLNSTVEDDRTCGSILAVEASSRMVFEQCFEFGVNLRDLADQLANGYLLVVPRCAIEITGAAYRVNGSQDPGRHLLQSSPATVELLLKVYVDSLPDGESVVNLFKDPQILTEIRTFIERLGVPITVEELVILYELQDLPSATSDPHFTSPHGIKYNFNGVAGGSYCIVTDDQLQVNARLMGPSALAARGEAGRPDTRTWMDQVALMHGSDRVLVTAEAAQGTPFALSFGTLHINGEKISNHVAVRKLPSGMTVARRKTHVLVTIPGLAVVDIEVVRAAFWEPGMGPGSNFLNVEVKELKPTDSIHGVLGQSYGKSFDGDVEGGSANYATSDIFASDCKFNKFDAQ
eukprot:jgi/Mesvir1/25576/Mv01807-RA.1